MHHTDTSPISTDAAPILQVRDVVKDFGGVRAVDHCTLTVMPGTITGLIGPNGAGKTTLFNLVSGALTPSAGRILFDGRAHRRDEDAPDLQPRTYAHLPDSEGDEAHDSSGRT